MLVEQSLADQRELHEAQMTERRPRTKEKMEEHSQKTEHQRLIMDEQRLRMETLKVEHDTLINQRAVRMAILNAELLQKLVKTKD